MRAPRSLSRALALAILAVPVALAYFLVVLPLWQNHKDTRAEAIELEEQAVRLLAAATEAERLSERRAALPSPDDLRPYLLTGASPTLAAVTLQKRVESLVARHGGQLVSTQVLRPETTHGFVRVGIRLGLTLDTPTLQRILHELEGRPPLLAVDELTVISRSNGETSSLDVRLLVSGWMHGEDA